ncbi:btb/poz domain-containing protein 19-like [Gigaspora margarita]|uniref:Btb/poz domain-containing protein 19-like n=1 Tax=Gigaspora margarita TaxID=4874 RepID=A0A8H4AAA9_GIGMA|nr:btb/poz domain-containing protein 19-like [Gigaspora margarita]
MVKTFPGDIAKDFDKLYESKEGYDTIIIAGEEPNVEEIYAHSLILRTRSSYFRSALSDEWVKKTNDGYLVLKKPNISAIIIKIILKFLYCEMVDLDNEEDETILDLLAAADELLIQNLIDYIQEYLIEYSSDFIEQVPIKMLHLISHHEKFNELKETCLETICETPNLLFDSDQFLSLEEDALKLILECDNLEMKECVIWKHLIRWGNAQRKTLESSMMDEDPKDEDIKNKGIDILEKILHELIKLIRFHQMDRKEFMDEVWPFRDLLPDKLIENVLRYYLEGADTLYNIFPIRWGNFEIDSDNLVGGYNPLDWEGDNEWKSTADSFLFLLDPNNIKNATISRVIQDGIDCAIGCDNVHGPSFGEGPDLHVSNNSNTWKFIAKSYSKIGISGLHAISDYEVFQVSRIKN